MDKEFWGLGFPQEEVEIIWKCHCKNEDHISALMTDGTFVKTYWKGLQGHRGAKNWV